LSPKHPVNYLSKCVSTSPTSCSNIRSITAEKFNF